MTMPQTLFDKIWETHEVAHGLLYIDLHLVHEVTSPQAFDSLRMAGRPVRRPDRTLATADHNTPTDGTPVAARIKDELSRVQVETLERNCAEFGVPVYSLGSERQGIVHVIGPELGVTQPGMTIVCGDSHTSTHGAFGALAFGIGTSEVEHVLATQCMVQHKPRSMRISYEGELGFGVTAKDLILGTLGRLGVGGMTGHVVEYAGPAIEALSMEGRMTVCNMTIEGGGRAGMIAPDETTFAWFTEPGAARRAARARSSSKAIAQWRELRTDEGAEFDTRDRDRRERDLPAGDLGDEPRDGARGHRERARARGVRQPRRPRGDRARARLHGPAARHADRADRARPRVHRLLHELADRRPARRREGRRRAARSPPSVDAMVVPGSQQVKKQAEEEGLDEVFRAAGFDWRVAGCSMCLGMNPDILQPGERCASTSNRNFEGRQGRGGRTHLVSPADGGRRRDRGPLRRHPRLELGAHGPDQRHRRRRQPPRPRRRRHRPDHAQAVPQARRAHGLRRVPVLRLGEGAGLGSAGQPDPRRGRELRLRLLARARAVGAAGLRLPGARRAELRRHLLLQLHEDRAAAGRALRARTAVRSRTPARARSTCSSRRCASPGGRSPSRSTTRSAIAC